MVKCAKCNDEATSEIVIEAGEQFQFCTACQRVLKDCPTQTIFSFLGPKRESWVAKNIRMAKERRASGKRLWI